MRQRMRKKARARAGTTPGERGVLVCVVQLRLPPTGSGQCAPHSFGVNSPLLISIEAWLHREAADRVA